MASESNGADTGGRVRSDRPAELPVLSLQHATKTFGVIRALDDVSIDLYPGEAHALVGENGAGKSTIVKLFAALFPPDSGRLLLNGHEVALSGTAEARDAGIAVIYQEPTLFPDLTVLENIFIGRQPLRGARRIDRRAMRAQAETIFDRLGVRLDPDRIALGLSIAEQQLVEIAKALSLDARVVVMDEPTAALSAVEVERLFGVAAALRESGVAVLFISHRLEEVFVMCQRVTVLRDGRLVLTRELAGLSADDLVRAMVGRELHEREASEQHLGETVLELEHLTREGVFLDVGFQVRAGEIVALAGLVGSGRSEVARAIFGVDRYDAGSVAVAGRKLQRGSPSAAMAAGIGLVPEDRRLQGLVMVSTITRNIALASLGRLALLGFIRSATERRFAADWAIKLQVKYGRLSNPISSLSGGNQQKVVLARWLARRPSLLIVDEPTRGIDIATKAEVHRLLDELAGQGVAILMISSELPEVLRVADRILVMREGRLVAEFEHSVASEQGIVAAATGQAGEAVA